MSTVRSNRAWCLVGVALTFATLACSPLMNTPSGFVEVKGEPYDYRASSADGLVIAVRELDHEPKGDLAFWVRAVENEMRLGRGYALLDTREVKTSRGLAGKEMRFGHDEGSNPHLYWVAVFVTDTKLYVIEAGGTKDLVEKSEALLEAAIVSLNAG